MLTNDAASRALARAEGVLVCTPTSSSHGAMSPVHARPLAMPAVAARVFGAERLASACSQAQSVGEYAKSRTGAPELLDVVAACAQARRGILSRAYCRCSAAPEAVASGDGAH